MGLKLVFELVFLPKAKGQGQAIGFRRVCRLGVPDNMRLVVGMSCIGRNLVFIGPVLVGMTPVFCQLLQGQVENYLVDRHPSDSCAHR